MKRPTPDFSVLDLLRFIQERKGKDLPNLLRVLPKILLAIAVTEGIACDLGADDTLVGTAFEDLAVSIPASRLLDCVVDGRWAPWVIERVPELDAIKAYKNDYRRCFGRCLKHAVESRLISTSARGVSPAWQQARERLAVELPYNEALHKERIDRGETEVHGHSLIEHGHKYFRTFLDSFNQMARYMTSIGVTDPRDVRSEHLHGPEASWYASRVAGNPEAMTGYSRARFSWEMLQKLDPETFRTDWPRPREERNYYLPRKDFSLLAERMLSEILQEPDLKDGTKQNIQMAFERLLGVLQHELGIDVNALCEGLYDPKDLAYLLIAGFGPTDDHREPDPEQEVRRILADANYRDAVIQRARLTCHSHSFKGACRRNSFLRLFADWMYKRKTPSILEVALKHFRIVGDRYLRVDKTQKEWLSQMLKQAVDTKNKREPSERARRKQAVAMDQVLWLKLVEALPRLSAHTAAMREQMDAVLADPMRTDEQRAYAKMRWAVAVRDELMIAMLLCFALRKENIQGIRIGYEVFPDEYRVSISPSKAKGNDWIKRTFPEAGPFIFMMALLDVYKDEARPILLDGRPETPYLFLTAFKGREVHDAEGHLRGGREQLPAIVRKACKKHFKDVLPPGVDVFNVHLIRDIISAYMMPFSGVSGVAQALGNTVQTAQTHYLKHHHQNDSSVRSVIETELPKTPVRTLADRRKAHREEIVRILGPEAPNSAINALLASYDKNR